MRTNVLVFLIVGVGVIGCTAPPASYPEAWDALGTGADIESQIAGWYTCRGVEEDGWGSSWNLIKLFTSEYHTCDRVRISNPSDGKLLFKFYGRPEHVPSEPIRLTRESDYEVRDGRIVLKSVDKFTGAALAREAWKATLAHTESGELVARIESSVFQLMGAFGRGSHWVRYPRIYTRHLIE